jgi:tetratricopeptide (TPR) repeat protein
MPDDPVLEAARNAAARGDICTARQNYRHLLSRYPVGHDDGESGAMAADHTAVLRLLARLEQGSGNYFEAEVLLLEALDRVERRFGKNDPLAGWIAAELGPLYQSTARLAEAEYFHRRALTLLEPVLEPHDTHLGILLNNLASVLVAADRHGEAIELMERTRAFALENADTGSAHAGPLFLVNLADTYRQIGRLVDAEQAYRTALARQRVEKGYRANFIAMTSLDGLAQIEAERGELTTATTLLRVAIGIGERMLEVSNGYCAGMPLYKHTHRRLEIINERYREMRALLHGGWV